MTSAPLKDVLIVGFGAIGVMYAFILKKSGLARVTAVARSNYDDVKCQGLTIRSKKYGEITGWKPDRLCNSVADAADQPYSYVLVATKAIPEINKTSDILKPLLSSPYTDQHAQPTYVLMQNGLNVEGELFDTIARLDKGPPSIISATLYIFTNLRQSNVVEHDNFDRTLIGVYRHKNHSTVTNSPEEASLLDDFGNLLEAGGTTLTIVPEIQRIRFKKNLWNVSLSSLATLTGYRLPASWRPPPDDTSISYDPYVSPTTKHLIEEYTLPSLKATLEELVALAHAMGFPDSPEGILSSYPEEFMAMNRKQYTDPSNSHTTSMLLDVQKGQPIEVEVILGEVVRLAREFKVAVPRVETLYAHLLVIQNQILRKIESNREHCKL